MKLFDKLNTTHKKKVLEVCDDDIISLIKEKYTFYSLTIIYALIIWESIYPKRNFNYQQFKNLFK